MQFGPKKGWHGLGGATKKEDSRDELLAKVKTEREARGVARKQERAALAIQRRWRGHTARQAVHAKRVQAWLQLYSRIAADPNQLIPVEQLLNHAVPSMIKALDPWIKQGGRQKSGLSISPPQPGLTPLQQLQASVAGLATTSTSLTTSTSSASAALAASATSATSATSIIATTAATSAAAPAASSTVHVSRPSPVSLLAPPVTETAATTSPAARAAPPPHSPSTATTTSTSSPLMAPVTAAAPAADALAIARGGLALLLRSVTTADPASCFCSPAINPTTCAGWVQSCCAVLQLCAGLQHAVGAASAAPQPVVTAGAARLMVLLTTPSHWKIVMREDEVRYALGGIQEAMRKVAAAPEMLLSVTARAVRCQTGQMGDSHDRDCTAGKAGDSKAEDSKAGDSKAGDSKAGDSKAGDSKAGDSGVGALSRLQQGSEVVTSRLLGFAVAVLESVCLEGVGEGLRRSTCEMWCKELLGLPGFLSCLTPAMKASLILPPLLHPILTSLLSLSRSSLLGPPPSCAHALATLVQLVAGESSTRQLPTGALVPHLRPSPVLKDPVMAALYMQTVNQLLKASLAGKAVNGSEELSGAVSAWWPLAEQTHILQLLDAAFAAEGSVLGVQGSTSGVQGSTAGLGGRTSGMLGCRSTAQDRTGNTNVGGSTGAVHGNTKWVQRSTSRVEGSRSGVRGSASVNTGSLAAACVSGDPGGMCGVALFCSLCATLLLHVAPMCQLPGGGQAAGKLPNPLNTLAFAPPLLPRLWGWLTTNLGVPREAPVEATRGLDVGSLAGGMTGLLPAHAEVLGVFCRVYAHLLLALDDNDFYSGSDPFSLAQARAIAASLNSLVFHTYFPAEPLPGAARAASRSPQKAKRLVSEWAPAVLRELYERDVRQSFCQPRLWLAPYLEMTGQTLEDVSSGKVGQKNQGAVIKHFNTAAVAQVLLAGQNNDLDSPSPDVTLQPTAGEGSRPASLASLLRAAPQCVPFSHRVDLFRDLLVRDKASSGYDLSPQQGGLPPMRVQIRRDMVMQDAFHALGHLGMGLKKKLHVTYINAQGLQEAGLDQGGLTKEFLDDVVRLGLGAEYGLFAASETGLAYPKSSANRVANGLRLLNFVGLMVGKALYEGILLDVRFAPFFIARLQGRRPAFDDLASLDPGLHRSLQQVKHYQGDVEELGLTFSVEDECLNGRSDELIPGWGSRAVTNDNKLLYCHLMADWHLNVKLGAPAAAFAAGLAHIIPPSMLRLFNPQEVNELISGGSFSGLDITDMRRWTRYSGGYGGSSIAIMLFWKVLSEFSPQQQSLLLKFITSCSRPPLGGFEYLQPPLTIHMVECEASVFARVGGKDVDRLPSASTCYNMLKLPNYRRPGTMKAKLLCAISANAGFELS